MVSSSVLVLVSRLQWCETQKDCERLRLMDLLVKPMQRLTKYSLLLKAILKKTDDDEQRQALLQMVRAPGDRVLHFVHFIHFAQTNAELFNATTTLARTCISFRLNNSSLARFFSTSPRRFVTGFRGQRGRLSEGEFGQTSLGERCDRI